MAMKAALGHGHVDHQCCWYVDGDTPCGLWCGHDGDHTPHQIGAYLTLATPLIHPLDILHMDALIRAGQWDRVHCTLCGTHANGYSLTMGGLIGRFYDGEDHSTYERVWQFEPCGCEGRELLNSTPTGEIQALT